MQSQILDTARAGLDTTLAGLDPTLAGLDPAFSDSDSDDVLNPGDIRLTVKNNGQNKLFFIESTYFNGVCRTPLEETASDGKYTCALTSANEVFAGTFETRGDLVAAVMAFAETAASESNTSTASIERLLSSAC